MNRIDLVSMMIKRYDRDVILVYLCIFIEIVFIIYDGRQDKSRSKIDSFVGSECFQDKGTDTYITMCEIESMQIVAVSQ
jgi:hypothetical protein